MRFKLHFKNIKISNKEVISLGLRQLQHIIFIKFHDDTNIPTIGKLAFYISLFLKYTEMKLIRK